MAEELGEEYSNKDPFSQEAFDDYYDKLSELEGLEEFEEEVSLNNSSSSVGVNPWNTPNTNVQTNKNNYNINNSNNNQKIDNFNLIDKSINDKQKKNIDNLIIERVKQLTIDNEMISKNNRK